MFLYAISFTFPLLLCSKRTIYRATVRPDLRTTVEPRLNDFWPRTGEICSLDAVTGEVSSYRDSFPCIFLFLPADIYYTVFILKLCLLLLFILKTANTSNVQTRRLYTYAVNQSTLSSTTKSILFSPNPLYPTKVARAHAQRAS